MVQSYARTTEAERGIERYIRDFYETQYPQVARREEPRLQAAIAEVIRAYRNNFSPEMRTSWPVYPDHIGHKEFPGCFRCHDGKHVSKGGTGNPELTSAISGRTFSGIGKPSTEVGTIMTHRCIPGRPGADGFAAHARPSLRGDLSGSLATRFHSLRSLIPPPRSQILV